MKVTISFRNLDHTASLDQRIFEKSERLQKYLGGRCHLKWNCSTHQGEHLAEVDLIGPGIDYHARATSDSLYKSLDLVMSKIEKQLHKKKERSKSRRIKIEKNVQHLLPEVAWGDYDEDFFQDAA